MKHWQGWVVVLLLLGVPAEVTAKPKVEREEHISVAVRNGSAKPLIALEPSMIMGKLDHTSYKLPIGNSYYNIHGFEGSAGESIVIELTSQEIDPYLLLLDSEGNVITEDDDGGSGQDARIAITLEQTGLYQIIASSGNSGGWGNYTLTWREASPNEIVPEPDESDSKNLMPLSRFSYMWQEPVPIDIGLEDIPLEYRDIDRTFEESMKLFSDPILLAQVIEIATSDLATARASNNRTGEMEALANLGFGYHNLEDYTQALNYYQQALSISRELKNRSEEARFLYCLGLVYTTMGDDSQAIEFHQQSADIEREMGDVMGLTGTLIMLGYLQDRLGRVPQQIDSYEEALAMARASGDRGLEAGALAGLGEAYFNLGQYAEAEPYIMDAIDIFEAVYLDELLSINPGGEAYEDADTIYQLDGQIQTYSLLQQVLVAQDKTIEALAVSERGRARVFKQRLWQRYGDGEQSTPPPPTLADIQQVARTQNATLVQYSVVEDEFLYIWVISPDGNIAFRSVEIAEKTEGVPLQELVDNTRFSMGVRDRSIGIVPRDAIEIVPTEGYIATATPRLQQLHQLLIEPISDLLPQTPTERVVFVPHNELFLVPFPALQDANGTELIDKHTLLTAPAIQVLQLAHRPNPPAPFPSREGGASPSPRRGGVEEGSDVLVVGNPVMPSISINPGDPPVQLSSLPGAEIEAKEIAQLLGTEPLIGNAATEPVVTARMQTSRIIHLATHGILDDAGGMGSSIALTPSIRTQGGVSPLLDSTDGFLTAGEILGLNLNANLVVLSACDTGRGKITGDGVVGLSRSLVTAGAQSVVVSLWKVPDDATAMLMRHFYDNLQGGLDKATALRNAMLSTRETHPAPVDWAAFTLIGAIDPLE